jgi:formylglycine-generating enzyme required for sulfatase activity/predicted Ser/Thr protein kinase
MSSTANDEQILAQLLNLGLADADDLPAPRPAPSECLERLVAQGRVTRAQIEAIRRKSLVPDAPPPPERPAGGTLDALGPYTLQEELGRGGMGVVYRATDGRLQREVAVKTLVAGEHASPELIARFVREAQAAAKLGSHPHIVPVLDVGRESSRHYIVMEFVDGDSLEHLIDEGAIPVRHAARYAAKVARAVQHAHDNGVYHRDLKPANVMVGGDNEPRLTDFGLARFTGGEHQRLTQSGALVGTPHYMAPEQVQGDYDAIDHRTDVYGVGAILYEMLTDAPPFGGGGTPDIIRKVVLDPPRAPRRANPGVPRDLETICLKALEKPKERRYQSAAALADELDRWLRGEPIEASPISGVSRMVRWARRKPFAAATLLFAAAAVVLGAMFGWTVWSGRQAWATQVADAETDLRYGKYAEAIGKFEALLKERPADGRLRALQAEAASGYAASQAARAAELQEAVREQQRTDRMAAARVHLATLREQIAALRKHRAALLSAQAEMQRLNAGGDPGGRTIGDAYYAASAARAREASAFFTLLNREMRSELGAFLAMARNAADVGAPGAPELLFAGVMEVVQLHRSFGDADTSVALQRRLERLLPKRPDLRPAMTGTLQLVTDPADAEVWIGKLSTVEGRLQPGAMERLEAGAANPVALAQSGYLVELRKAGYATARVPVWVRDGEAAGDAEPVRLLRPSATPDGMVYVPRGACYFGAASGTRERWYFHRRVVPGFFIGETEITLREYAEFLLDQRVKGRPDREYMPMYGFPKEYRPLDWEPLPGGGERLAMAEGYEDAPAMGITRPQAEVYVAWRSQRDGRTYRLPSESEWVRAARGGDVRPYPWGYHFASNSAVQASWFRRGALPPARPKQAPLDVSPFGVHDMAGSVQEWVSDWYDAKAGAYQVRGGSWSSSIDACRVDRRHRVDGDTVTMDFGLRLVADLPAK